MAGLGNGAHQHVLVGVALQEDHLRTRDHDVTHLHFVHLQYAFEHGERIHVDEMTALRAAQHIQQLFDIGRFPQQQLFQSVNPGVLYGTVGRSVFIH